MKGNLNHYNPCTLENHKYSFRCLHIRFIEIHVHEYTVFDIYIYRDCTFSICALTFMPSLDVMEQKHLRQWIEDSVYE